MYPGGYGGYGGYGCYGGYGGYGGGYGGHGGYGMNPYQAAQMQAAQMQQARMQQASMHQQMVEEQVQWERRQGAAYMHRAQQEQADRVARTMQNARIHQRQPRGFVIPNFEESSEVAGPRGRHSNRCRDRDDSAEESRNRMARMHMMSDGLGPRDDDFIRNSRRGGRDDRGRSHRGSRDDEESEGEEDFVYDRRGPRRGRSYRDRRGQMFGGGSGGYGGGYGRF